MDVPGTVTAAPADRPVTGAVCLEAGAGAGNATASLLAAGAGRIYAVTNDGEHADAVRGRVGRDEADRVAVLEAELRSLPLAADECGNRTGQCSDKRRSTEHPPWVRRDGGGFPGSLHSIPLAITPI